MKNKIFIKCITILLVLTLTLFSGLTNTQAATTNNYLYIQINGTLYKVSYNGFQKNPIVNENKTENYDFKDVIYYCNTSLKESLKIDDSIKQKALSLTKNHALDFNKALKIYEFVSSYIMYDYERYYYIKNKQNMCNWQAGAMYAYYNKKGVCFEYATLFASMASYVGLKIRIVYGENHIWDQFYDKQTSTWVSVDATWKKFNFDVKQHHKVYAVQAEF